MVAVRTHPAIDHPFAGRMIAVGVADDDPIADRVKEERALGARNTSLRLDNDD
jgi:hypothetical protein